MTVHSLRIISSMLVLLASAHALAQPTGDEAARIHFQAATDYFQVADYDAALAEFTRAYELSQRPQLLYNLYLCHERLGHLERAVAFLERFLREAPSVPERPTLEARLTHMHERLENEQAAAADVTAAPDTTAAPNVAAAPDTTAAPNVAAAPDTTAAPNVAAEPDTTDESAPSSTTPPTPATTHAAPAETEHELGGASPPGRNPHSGRRIAGYAVLGVSAAAALGAGVFGLLALREDGNLDGRCGSFCQRSDIRTLQRDQSITDASLAVGVVALGVGLALVLSSGRGESPVVTVGASRQGLMASTQGSF